MISLNNTRSFRGLQKHEEKTDDLFAMICSNSYVPSHEAAHSFTLSKPNVEI